MKENIKEMINKHSYTIGLYVRDDFAKNFNETTYRIINEIKENASTATQTQWRQWIMDGKSNKNVQEYIAMHPETPEYAIHMLLTVGRTYQDTCLDLAKRKNISDFLAKMILSISNDTTIERIMIKMGEPEEKINSQMANAIVPVLVDGLIDGSALKCREAYFAVFEQTHNEDMVLKLLNSGIEIPETVLNKIASNKNLSDKTRNQAFDLGCDFEKLTSINSYMAKTIYESAIDAAIDDGTTSHDIWLIRNKATKALNMLSEQEVMDDAMIIDILNRIYDKNLTPYCSKSLQLIEALQKTKSSNIIEHIYNFANKFDAEIQWKKLLINLSATTDKLKNEIMQDVMADFYKKYNSEKSTYYNTTQGKEDIRFIAEQLSKYNFSNDIYNTLLIFLKQEACKISVFSKLKTALVSSPYISNKIIDEIDSKGNSIGFNDAQIFYARISKGLRSAGLNEYSYHIICGYQEGYTNVCDIKDIETIKKAKLISLENIQKINNEKIKTKLLEQTKMFDTKIHMIETDIMIKDTPKSLLSKYNQGLRKQCEVYAYIDDFIDAIEKEKTIESKKSHDISR